MFVLFIFFTLLVFGLGFCKFILNQNNNINKIKVSIVIPVYNTEKYLDACLESVENQSLKDIEIICINDGSTDNSLEILNKHKFKDNRIKIINQENSGVSAARNAGIKNSTGEYILFVDSDDIIFSNTCEINYNNSNKFNTDITQFNNISFQNDTEINYNISYDSSKINFSKRNKHDNPFYKLNIEGSVIWNKLWNREFLIKNNIYFKEGVSLGEDSLFDWIAISEARRVLEDENVFYCYRVGRENSAMQQSNLIKKLKNYMLITQNLFDNYYRFCDFKDGEQWFLNLIFWLNYDNIFKLENNEDKVYFAQEFVNILEQNLQKNNIKLKLEHSKKIEDLKNIK